MKSHILLVDDDQHLCATVSRFLSQRACEVTTASSCDQALHLVRTTRPDLVLLDVVLADGDGLELLSLLKIRHPHLPIVLLNKPGSDTDFITKAAKEAGEQSSAQNVFLEKLSSKIERFLSFESTSGGMSGHSSSGPGPEVAAAPSYQ